MMRRERLCKIQETPRVDEVLPVCPFETRMTGRRYSTTGRGDPLNRSFHDSDQWMRFHLSRRRVEQKRAQQKIDPPILTSLSRAVIRRPWLGQILLLPLGF